MPAPIPLSQPDITQAEIDAVTEVLLSKTLTRGPRLEEFEHVVAKVCGRRHAIGVSSGTAGLHCAMVAAGVGGAGGAGDEVITTPFSFVASANAALFVGAKPVFVDIDPVTLNMDVEKVAEAITPRTKAIMAVEMFGHPGGMIELEQLAQRHELILIEDACEGFGGYIAGGAAGAGGAGNGGSAGAGGAGGGAGGSARTASAISVTPSPNDRPIGSFGRAGVFSFYTNKQITTGEGGMIVTDDDAFAAACRALRSQGRQSRQWLAHHRLGYNYRLDEMSAALGVAQVRRLEEILENRRRVAHAYISRLMTNRYLILPTLLEHTQVSWFVFVVRLNDLFEPGDRDEIMEDLRAEGIECEKYFPPLHLQPYIRDQFGFKPGDFPVTEYVSARTLALPFFTRMLPSQIKRVCDVLEGLLEKTLMRGKGRF